MKIFLIGVLLALNFAHAQSQFLNKSNNSVVTTPRVRAELLAYAPDGIQAGKTVQLGLQLQHQPGWHTYWRNPGDSGLPTKLDWTLPAGATAGSISWPTPQRIEVGPLVNYGYEGAVLLSVPVTIHEISPTTTDVWTVRLKAQWLACKTECIPEEGEFALSIPVRSSTGMTQSQFAQAKGREPPAHAGAASVSLVDTRALELNVKQLPASWQGKRLDVFPETEGLIENAAKPQQTWRDGQWVATLPLHAQRTQSPSSMAWVIKIAGGPYNPSFRVQTPLVGAWPATVQAKPSEISPALAAALEQNKQEASSALRDHSWLSYSYALALLGALLGGLMLNLMPCVLPVLAIKLLSFAPKKSIMGNTTVASVLIEPTGAASVYSDHVLSFRSSSGLFGLGVIGCFSLVGASLLALRAGGQSLGWGFQLQSPYMVAALMVLFLLIALNLFEAFEVRLVLPQRLVQFQPQFPMLEALFSGALAVLIATPCTAPFMGASLGLAISLPWMQAMLIFIVLGVGMAAPFLLIALYPRFGRWLSEQLPKPGPWMLVMRRCLAWPVLACVLWLLWIYAQQTDIHSATALMFVLLMLAACIWGWALPRGRVYRAVKIFLALGLAAALALWSVAKDWADMTRDGGSGGPELSVNAAAHTKANSGVASKAGEWRAWSLVAQQEARAAGRIVLVDFTAAWCITCQVNKATTLSRREVEQAFQEKNVVLLRADWTAPNPDIAAQLLKLGRSGLPVYALYWPGQVAPQLLPEVLTPSIVLEALAGL